MSTKPEPFDRYRRGDVMIQIADGPGVNSYGYAEYVYVEHPNPSWVGRVGYVTASGLRRKYQFVGNVTDEATR